MSACCMCCAAADERGELDHALGESCPYPSCDYCQGCTCPLWEGADDYDGWQDYADACSACPLHGTAVAS